ncbi:hypothetical protein ULVI_09265 [Cochleicola gelatinilyticus]|uniref:Uncharacterized protein n=1 Tax=Cochleicola gelatinilyticus TaxID=1763537 RepID=A0A167HM40_9FLAO|nr:hypothetical protein ULVI_09265 [Cochleicola gelatinilyticus]
MYTSFYSVRDSLKESENLVDETYYKIIEAMGNRNLTKSNENYNKTIETDSLGNALLVQVKEGKEEIARIKSKTIERNNKALNYIFFLGMLMMVFGFYLWYQRVQKPIDSLTQLQLAKLKIEILNNVPSDTEEEK